MENPNHARQGSPETGAAGRHDEATRDRLGMPGRIALAFFALAAAYFLWTEHRAHVLQVLPWAIVAVCPLMHLFMHHGHGRHHGHGVRPDSSGPGEHDP